MNKLLVILSGKGAYSWRSPVHLVHGDAERTLCEYHHRDDSRWALLDDTPENRTLYVKERGKHICYHCQKIVDHNELPATFRKPTRREQRQRSIEEQWEQFTGRPFPGTQS
jgi:hypothetical protein